MLLDGPAARALAELARARWQCAAGERVPLAQDAGDVWPREVAADFTDVEVGIARTQPRFEDQQEVREVEALFLDGIAAAERTLYIENQFLSCIPAAKALAGRCANVPSWKFSSSRRPRTLPGSRRAPCATGASISCRCCARPASASACG